MPHTPSESDTQTPSESADEWTKFRRAADQAASASSKAKSPGPKKSKGIKGSPGPKDSKSSASAVTKTGSGKGSKCKGKEAGLAEKPRWDTSYKIPKRSAPDTSVSSGGPTPRKAGKVKRPTKKVTKKSSTPNQSADAPAKSKKGSASAPPSASTDLPLNYWANNRPGDEVIPANAERVEWAGGLVLFQDTRHHPLISVETEREARRQTGQCLELWRVELIQHERDSLDSSRTVGASISPDPANLPRVPPWAAPNGWDYRGRPWAYLDAPSSHREVGASSTLSPTSTRVTVAVLVDCPHEPQFLPDMVVAQSASVAAGRATRQARQFTQKGEIQENMTLETAAKRLLPHNYGERYSVAVLEQLKAWEAFWTLNIGRRENPTIPRGDVTPLGCPRAKFHGQAPETLSGRPVVTARAAETTCRSQASSSQTASTDRKLQQRPVVDLSRLGEEELKGISSKGSTQRPRTGASTERARPQVTGIEPMEVDTAAVPSTSRGSSASAAVRPKEKGTGVSQTHTRPTGPCQRVDQKAKQRATDQHGVRAMVANVLERQGVEPEDWEQPH